MKRLKYILLSLLAVVFAACQDDMPVNRPAGGLDADGNVRLCFNTEIPDMEQVQTRAVDPDGYGVNSLWLFTISVVCRRMSLMRVLRKIT